MFYQGCLFRKLYHKRSIFYILERKEWLLDQKKCGFKQSKNRKYFKGVSPSFLSKNRIFYQQSLFRKLDQKRSFFDILERKEWLLDPKKWSFKKSKKSKFFKGVSPWFFVKKSNILSRVFILQIRPEKIVFWYSWQERKNLNQKSEVLKSPKNRNFSNGIVHGFCQKIEYFFKGIFWAI